MKHRAMKAYGDVEV